MGKGDDAAAGKEDKGPAEVIKSLSPEVMKRVEALAGLQGAFGEQHAAYVAEYKALQQKYHDVYADLWAKRADIVNGKVDPAEAAEGKPKGIEGFWLQALQNGRRTGATIEEHDEPALKALTDVKLEYLEGFEGFRLVFHFAPNEFFTDATLVKTFHVPHMLGGGKLGADPVIEKLVGSDVHWKAGKDLTSKEVKKTTKKKGKKVTVTKKEPQESFFRFFGTPNMSDDVDDMEPEEAYELQGQIHAEMDVGFEIKNKIIPRAIDWFTGEAVADESDSDDDEDEDGDDEYDDEEDDEEEEEKPKKGGKKGGKGKKHDDDDEDDEDGEGGKAALASALAAAFAKSLGGKKGGKTGKGAKDEEEDDEEEEEGGAAPAAAPAGADGEKPPECKQQ